MKKTPTPYTLIKKLPFRPECITIKTEYQNYGRLAGYRFLEVSADYDYNTGKVKAWHYRRQCDENDGLADWTSQPERDAWPEAIQDARDTITRQLKQEHKTIVNCNHPAINTMRNLARALIKHYPTDFSYHDTRRLAILDPATPFIWMVRETGTWLIVPDDEPKHRTDQRDLMTYREEHRFFYWNGHELTEVTKEKALDLFDQTKGH